MPPRALRLAALAAAALALGACGGDEPETAPAPTGAATQRPAGPTFTNPVHRRDFPDPFVLKAGDTYWAYATNSGETNVQTLTSTDLVRWTPGADALPEVGRWAYEGKTWAPEVLAVDGRYVLYYTAIGADYGKQCVGRAVADGPGGPFVDERTAPLVCQEDEGGTIDPSPFRDDDGSLYLLFKNDGNCCNLDTFVYAQRLSADGLELEGEPARLVRQDAGWEGSVVEAPTLWREGGRLVLFFSASDYASESYAVGYATCESPLGPCEDAPENPILETACAAAGPGHQALFRDGAGDTWLAYHAWPRDAVGAREPGRLLWLDRLDWEDGKPVMSGPTCTPQAAPAP